MGSGAGKFLQFMRKADETMTVRRMLSAVLVIAELFLFAGCSQTQEKTITIAVIGNEDDLYPGYREGADTAAEDLRRIYAESGYKMEYQFYSYDGSYEEGSAIIDMLAADEAVTAVVGGTDMSLNKTAAYVLNKAEKLFIVPFFLHDSVFDNNHYTMVFSMCNSGYEVGVTLRYAASGTTAKRWAVCSADREFERTELRGFIDAERGGDIDVVDCVNISELQNNLDEVFRRWETLGVEGVVLFPEDKEGFSLLKEIKQRSPSMICAGDTAFDNTDIIMSDSELMAAMTGFIVADEFILDLSTQENVDEYIAFIEDYTERTGKEMDSWYIQGYNTIRMIGDTAVSAGTTDPVEISAALHENGYDGIAQTVQFTADGKLANADRTYNVFDSEGYVYPYIFVDEE